MSSLKKQEEKLPALAIDFEEMAGEGLEEYSAQDFAIPFLRLLQPLSPQAIRKKDEYIEGAEPGMLLNSATNDLFEDFTGIICHHKRSYIEWIPRNEGGGFVAEYKESDGKHLEAERTETDDGRIVDLLPNGNELKLTHTFYALQITDNGYHPVIICMTSTQIKKAKQLNSLIDARKGITKEGKSFKYPIFAGVYKLKVISDSNNKGDFFNWSPEFVKIVDNQELFDAAKDFRKIILEGQAKVDYNKADENDGENGAF